MDGASASASKPQNVYTLGWGTSDLPVASSLGFIGRKGRWLFSAPCWRIASVGGTLKARGHQNALGWLLRGSRGSMQRSDPARWVSDLASLLEFRRVTATTTRRRRGTAALLFCLWPSVQRACPFAGRLGVAVGEANHRKPPQTTNREKRCSGASTLTGCHVHRRAARADARAATAPVSAMASAPCRVGHSYGHGYGHGHGHGVE